MLEERILFDIQEYVQNHLDNLLLEDYQTTYQVEKSISGEIVEDKIEDFIEKNRKPTLKQVLFSYIDNSGASDPEIYHKAGIDRKHFSKIRSNPNYRPGKNTIIALALALELTKRDTDTLLNAAGYALSNSDTYDLVVQFCIEKKIYKIHDVNQALDFFNLKPLIE